VLVKLGVFAYNDDFDSLFGVGPWLSPLYFAFVVVVALPGELAAKNSRADVRSSHPGMPAPR
jgi:hypothetical protein